MQTFETTHISGVLRVMALNAAAKTQDIFGTNDRSIRLSLLKEFLAYYSTIACNEICLKLNDINSDAAMKAFDSIRGDLGSRGLVVTESGHISETDERIIASLANDPSFHDSFAAYWNGDMIKLKISGSDIEHFSELGLEMPTSDPTHIASYAFQVRIFRLGKTSDGEMPPIPILSLCSSELTRQIGICVKSLKYFIDIEEYYGKRKTANNPKQDDRGLVKPLSPTVREMIAFLEKKGLAIELTDAAMKAFAENASLVHGVTTVFDSNIGNNKGSYNPATKIIKINPGRKTTDAIGNTIVVGRATADTPWVMLAHHIWAKMPEHVRQRFTILAKPEIDGLNLQRAEYNKGVSAEEKMKMIDPEHFFTSEVGCKTVVQLCTGNKGLKNWFSEFGALLRVKNDKCDLKDIYRVAIYWLVNVTPKRDNPKN